jgi:hypothetical protein
MCGTIPLSPIYILMAWTGITLPLTLCSCYRPLTPNIIEICRALPGIERAEG